MSDCIVIDPSPDGVNPPEETERKPIQRVVAGDTIKLRVAVTAPNGDPATESNSKLVFRLVDQRFSSCYIWEGLWNNGIEPTDRPGVVQIKIPDTVSARLRRGSFLYSLVVSDQLGNDRSTVCEGSLLVEYSPTSPIHNIPYHDGCEICNPMDECPECPDCT